ncbi:tRNA lysidine(34) synthetase TilS [Candidatus Vidania fulgoroideae]|uniref:tRNA(Ile)-lysidine synthase n=1 Tax=Candidatus Vidania fulgoroideorum TaxID=881286 RepID=A0AAX3N8N4_9PROT|nr:tRNA lysidine(34) synthetase TilS [Candidatus Vidania fulgoroideae]
MKILKSNIYRRIIKKKKKIGIAFSGGFDSSKLLKFCQINFKKNKIYLIHINHNINSKSKNWESFCKKIAKKKNVNFISKSIKIKRKKIKKDGLESEARKKRYDEILKISKKKKIKYVFFAHHLDDQIETFFLRIIRGTSNYGLRCMKEFKKFKNIFIVRPFINYEIKKINIKKPKKFIIDDSNYNHKIGRNFIRKYLKIIEKKFPFYRKTIKRFIKINLNNSKIIELMSKLDFKKTKMLINNIIKIKNKIRRLNLLSYFLRIKKFLIPSKKWLEELDKQILSGKNFLMKKKNFSFFIKNKKLKIC